MGNDIAPKPVGQFQPNFTGMFLGGPLPKLFLVELWLTQKLFSNS